MKNNLLLIPILSILILISACSKNKETELIVKNNTNGTVWIKVNSQENQTLYPNSSKTYSWILKAGGLSTDEEKIVNMSYNGYTVFQNDTTFTLTAGEIKTFPIDANGGCIKIINDSEDFTITQVYISPSDSLYWGDNLLSDGYIAPQDSVSWTCTSDNWDIKVVDDFGDFFTAMDNYIGIDDIYRFVYTGFKKNNIPIKKKEGKLNIKGLERNRYGN